MTRPTLTYSRSPYSRTKLKMNFRGFSSRSVLAGAAPRFRDVQDGIEDELSLLDPPAGQPLDLHEELGAEPEERLLADQLVLAAR